MSGPLASPARYPIRAVSRLTGIAIDTLRAWERRYGAVTPTRDDRGRMYTEADVARLRLLNGAVEQGHSIGRLAGLSNDRTARPLRRGWRRRPARGRSGTADAARYDRAHHRAARVRRRRPSTRSSPGWPRFCVRSTSSRTC